MQQTEFLDLPLAGPSRVNASKYGWLGLALAIGCGFVLCPGVASAQQEDKRVIASPDGNTRQYLESYKNDQGDDFILELVTVPPGGSIAPHVHSAVAHNYILEGEVDSQYDGEDIKHLKAGDTVQDKVGVVHKLWHNTSSTIPLKFLVAFTVKKGQPFLTFK